MAKSSAQTPIENEDTFKTIRIRRTLVKRIDALVEHLKTKVNVEQSGVKVSRSSVIERGLEMFESSEGRNRT